MGNLIQFPSLEQTPPPDDYDDLEKVLVADSRYEFMRDLGYGIIGVTCAGFFIKGVIDVLGADSPITGAAGYMLMAAPLPVNAVIGRYTGKLLADSENVREKTVSEKECKNLGTLIGTSLTGAVAIGAYITGSVISYGVKTFASYNQ